MYNEEVITEQSADTNLLAVEENEEPEVVHTDPGFSIECYCVWWIRESKGVPIRGNAYAIEPNVDHAIPGGVVLLEYENVSHAAYIKAILPNGSLYIEEANYEPCEVTERVIDPDEYNIRGYWYKNPNA